MKFKNGYEITKFFKNIMKHKKKIYLAIFLIAILAVWISPIFWLPLITKYVSINAVTCNVPSGCPNLIGPLGATGDMFGSITSLFSALALFSVAVTLWVDSKSRREGKKPLVIATLDKDLIFLDNPAVEETHEILLNLGFKFANQTADAALNVSVHGKVSNTTFSKGFDKKYLSEPLIYGSTASIQVKIKFIDEELKNLLGALTDDKQTVELEIQAEYMSLEGVMWFTKVIYVIYITKKDKKRLNAVRSRTDDFENEWANANVPFEVTVKDNSWDHKQLIL